MADGNTFTIAGTAAAGEGAGAEESGGTAEVSGTNADTVSGAAFSGESDAEASYKIIDDGSGKLKLQKGNDDDGWADVTGYEDLSDGDEVTDGDFSFTLDSVADGNTFTIAGTAAAAEGEGAGGGEGAGEGEGEGAGAGAAAGTFTSSLDLKTDAGAASALSVIDAAIKTVNTAAQGLGNAQNRLDFKAQNLETSRTNYEAANSRIADADFAREQMEVVKLQILQQTGSAMFAQANASAQSVLSFF